MLRNDDNETEILLGNKQLLGIFFVVAILLGIAFYGGYMVGKAAPGKKTVASAVQDTAGNQSSASAPTGGETHTLTANDNPPTEATSTEPVGPPPDDTSTEGVLGARKAKKPEQAPQPEVAGNPEPLPVKKTSSSFTPEPGQQFLQVAAVGRDEALAVADVLHAKGFPAHAVPKPGNPKIYRVLIGPVRDTGDLSSTRDGLRRNGFREVIVQKY
jgi:cell division protein FtsN